MRARLRLDIRGAVQGVGFRPFVHRLAARLGLGGGVRNDARGVVIEVEGERERINEFTEWLQTDKPPAAALHAVRLTWQAPQNETGFRIGPSHEEGAKQAVILPDLATCADCHRELVSAGDRRHQYPFTNCTNCGPRFSIIQALPYDRGNTTMAGFVMCEECEREYHSVHDRRFHAQPNACPHCGPHLSLVDHAGGVLAEHDPALGEACRALRAGQLLAVKGLGGFHVMVDATNQPAVARLRERKARWEKPLALMVRNLAAARELCEVPAPAAEVLSSPPAPILLLRRRPQSGVADAVAPGNPYLGMMLAYTPLHHLLLDELMLPVVATSGNRSEEPICIDNSEALRRLGPIADLFLMHDRPIERHIDDSVALLEGSALRLLRRARGYAPLPVPVPAPLDTILAVGPHLKNTVALGVGSSVMVSQHIGDLTTPEAAAAHDRVIGDLLRMYEAHPVAIAHDLHPDYASTHWVEQRSAGLGSLRRVGVQHHHAHLAACLADCGDAGPALGVIWDGSGWGPDHTVWGGELLLGSAAGFERVAHFKQFRLPGSEAAVREPRRAALGLLFEMYGVGAEQLAPTATVDSFTAAERGVLFRMLGRHVNAPLTSSAGRLFDAVASLIGLRHKVSFEGQAAAELEYLADAHDADEVDAYPAELRCDGDRPLILDWGPMVEAILSDTRQRVPARCIAGKFHNTLAEFVVQAAAQVARTAGVTKVALSGGCFQNRVLTRLCSRRLERAGFQVLRHQQVPPNDGGISLGQVMVAAAKLGQA